MTVTHSALPYLPPPCPEPATSSIPAERSTATPPRLHRDLVPSVMSSVLVQCVRPCLYV